MLSVDTVHTCRVDQKLSSPSLLTTSKNDQSYFGNNLTERFIPVETILLCKRLQLLTE